VQLRPLLRDDFHIVSNRTFKISIGNLPINTFPGLEILSRDMVRGEFEKQQKNVNKKFFIPLEDSSFDVRRTSLIAVADNVTQDCFLIKKISREESDSIFFARSGIYTLQKFTGSFYGQQKEYHTNEYHSLINGILIQMLAYLFDIEPSEDHDYNRMDKTPIPYRQHLLKEMRYFELLTDILFLPIHLGYYQLERLRPEMSITQIYKNTYSAIKYISQEYRPNELYASQWLMLIIEQSLKTQDSNDVGASATLTELLDNNKRILETRIDDELIDKFIEYLCTVDKEPHYLKT
jgi:hypothetical protein